MTELDSSYEDFQEITYEDFYEMFWMEVSDKIVTTAYINKNQDFIDALTFDYWRLFEMNGNTSIRVMARTAEAFFYCMFRYRPSKENIKEIPD